MRIKANNSKGYYELVGGGIFDASYPTSKKRRGRVQDNGRICPTVTTQGELMVMEEQSKEIIIDGVMDNSDGTLESANRVYSQRGVAPLLDKLANKGQHPFVTDTSTAACYRIRRLTETECLRLMGVSEEDIKKITSVVSPTQAYKQAGNSIVVDVMVAIFDNLFNEKEESGTQMSFLDL